MGVENVGKKQTVFYFILKDFRRLEYCKENKTKYHVNNKSIIYCNISHHVTILSFKNIMFNSTETNKY